MVVKDMAGSHRCFFGVFIRGSHCQEAIYVGGPLVIFEVLITLLLVSFFRHAGLLERFQMERVPERNRTILGLGITNNFILDCIETNTWNVPTSRLD